MGGPPLPSTVLDEEGLPKPPVRDIEEVERPEMEEADPSLPLRDMAAAAELVERFVDITGASSPRAHALLHVHGWNLERALRAHDEAEEKIESIERGRAPRSTAKGPSRCGVGVATSARHVGIAATRAPHRANARCCVGQSCLSLLKQISPWSKIVSKTRASPPTTCYSRRGCVGIGASRAASTADAKIKHGCRARSRSLAGPSTPWRDALC